MAYLVALLTFVALSSACWFVSLACYRSTVAGSDPAAAPHYRAVRAAAVGVAAVTSFVPFPLGYIAGLVGWAAAAFGGLGLTAGRAAVLFGYLAATSYAARRVVLGVMEMMGS
jgi:hypothetical protein